MFAVQTPYRAEALEHTVPINISGSPFNDSTEPQIAISGSNLAAAWKQSDVYSENVFVAISTDSGETFEESINVGDGPAALSNLKIAISGTDGAVAWQS